jgi:hypothetical protein
MNKLLISLLFAVVISGCNKSGNAENPANDDPIPTANFKINNTVAYDTILEGLAVEFENNSQFADSYEWDFGDGMVSTERIPRGIVYRQCPGVREIRLVVRTRRGRTATHIRTIHVRCR